MVLLSLKFEAFRDKDGKKRYLELQYMQCFHLHPAMPRNILRKNNSITLQIYSFNNIIVTVINLYVVCIDIVRGFMFFLQNNSRVVI